MVEATQLDNANGAAIAALVRHRGCNGRLLVVCCRPQYANTYASGWSMANSGRGVPVFVGLLVLAAAFSIGTMIAEVRPRA